MRTIVFFLEEESAKAFLENFMPRFLPQDNEYIYITFEGKQDMEKQLFRKLNSWRKSNSSFIIIRDQDKGDCLEIKMKLSNICQEAGRSDSLIRIACRELESWYLGDLAAVSRIFDNGRIAKLQKKSKYRNPDLLQNPDQELSLITKGLYQKVSSSRLFGSEIGIFGNYSHSFNVFLTGIRNLCG